MTLAFRNPMSLADLLLEMTLRLAGAHPWKQEDDPPAPLVLKPVPPGRPTTFASPIDLQFTYSTVNPRHLDRRDLASWQHASGDLAPGIRLHGAAYAGDEGGRWIEGGIEARPLGWLALNASYVDGSGYTVHREIFGANLPMIDSRESGLRLTVGVTWTF